jgi:hypothetical protein
MHSENNYNARVIRGLILSTHETNGLPRRGFYFERGIWQSSRIVTGGERASDELTTDDTEAGLRDLGVKFIHARLPRSKLVERVLGILQSQMEHEPGYCGRNEQTDKFERLQRNLQLARAGHIKFEDFLLHRDVWVHRLTEICDEYNSERQDGRLLGGLTPRELWDTKFDFNQPLVRLGDDMRYILANHRRPLRVTKNGLCVQVGKERRWFRNESTGHLVGRTVQAYFNPDDLSSIWIRTQDTGREALVIPCEPTVPAMDADPDALAAAMASCQAHNRAAVTLYKAITPHFPNGSRVHFRQNVISPEAVEQGREIGEQQATIRAQQDGLKRQKQQLTNFARRHGSVAGSESVSVARRLKMNKLIEEATQ